MKQKYKNITLAPYCSSHLSLNEMLKVILICLIPHIIMTAVSLGLAALQLQLLVLIASICSEMVYNAIHKKNFCISWYTILQGILIGLLIPTDYIYIAAFLITFVILFLEKMIFSSFAQSWVNTIAITVIVLYFVAPSYFPNFLLDPNNVNQPNAGMSIFSDGLLSVARYDTRITSFLNNTIFSTLGLSVPEGYITLFWDSQSSIPAFRFNVLTLLASTLLFITRTINALIPVVFLLTYSFLVYMFSLYPYADIIGNGDILLAIFTSGTLYAAFFLIGWFGTTPLTLAGKTIYGICAGVLTFCICGAGTSSVGIIFVTLILNVICPIIQQVETNFYVSKIRKTAEAVGMARR